MNGVLSGIECFESIPNTKEFPHGVPDWVDLDTRLYMLVPPLDVNDTVYAYAITHYSRASHITRCYLTDALWDFDKHGPEISAIGNRKTAAHREAVKAAGGEVRRL